MLLCYVQAPLLYKSNCDPANGLKTQPKTMNPNPNKKYKLGGGVGTGAHHQPIFQTKIHHRSSNLTWSVVPVPKLLKMKM